MKPRSEPALRTIARVLVQNYLDDQGGEWQGFTWGPWERLLCRSIEREMKIQRRIGAAQGARS